MHAIYQRCFCHKTRRTVQVRWRTVRKFRRATISRSRAPAQARATTCREPPRTLLKSHWNNHQLTVAQNSRGWKRSFSDQSNLKGTVSRPGRCRNQSNCINQSMQVIKRPIETRSNIFMSPLWIGPCASGFHEQMSDIVR